MYKSVKILQSSICWFLLPLRNSHRQFRGALHIAVILDDINVNICIAQNAASASGLSQASADSISWYIIYDVIGMLSNTTYIR